MGSVIDLASRRPNAAERWLNKRQAAQHLGVSTRWVETQQVDGDLPMYKVKGMCFYKASELDEWVRQTSR
jgi:predicted DNA-binding transcriptional regulator AlpA